MCYLSVIKERTTMAKSELDNPLCYSEGEFLKLVSISFWYRKDGDSWMKVGIVKETKDGERRVACTPTGVRQLVANGHEVFIETEAGVGSGFSDRVYQKKGGTIVASGEEVFQNSELVYKVKELTLAEYHYLRADHIILSFLHTNSDESETEALLASQCTAIALEDITDDSGGYPLLKPMSELAGKVGFIEALHLLKTTSGGCGLLLNHVSTMRQPEIVIFGAGNAGRGAGSLAAAFGNKVTILGRGAKNLALTKKLLPETVHCMVANSQNIKKTCKRADVIINCVLWPKNRAGHLLSRQDLKFLKENCLIVDVACDTQGAIESCRPTSISQPTYQEEGRTHFCVDNLPAYYASTATEVLCKATLPYVSELANKGQQQALIDNPHLRAGLTTYQGMLTIEETAVKQGRTYTKMTVERLLAK